MKMLIDRGSTEKDIYLVEYGVDWDIMVGVWRIPMNVVSKEAMAEADRIFTKSSELKFCVMYIKHPLLLKSYTQDTTQSLSNIWQSVVSSDEKFLKEPLRSYFAIRLQHRKFPVDLTEIGKRLFT